MEQLLNNLSIHDNPPGPQAIRNKLFSIIGQQFYKPDDIAVFLWHAVDLYSRSDTEPITIESLTENEIRILRRKSISFLEHVASFSFLHNQVKLELSFRCYKSAYAIFRVEMIPWIVNALSEQGQKSILEHVKTLAAFDTSFWTKAPYDEKQARSTAEKYGYTDIELDRMIGYCRTLDDTRLRNRKPFDFRKEYELGD